MATTTLEAVWAGLVEALAAIDPSDGYFRSVRTVSTDRLQLESLQTPLTPALVVLLDEQQTLTLADSMPSQDGATFVFRLLGRIDCPGLDASARVTAYAELRADIRRALARNATLNGAAWDTRIIGGVGPDMDQGRIVFRFDVAVSTTIADEAS